jgi:CRP/FNR family transcriptional regulator, cyclic AMP receptor protein
MPEKPSLPIQPTTGIPMARLFKDVPVEIQKTLLTSAVVLPLEKGERLFEHGDQGGTMYLVQKGRIEISLITEDGKKIILNQIGKGHSFGEIAMVDKSPRTASAIAIESSAVIPITSFTFLETVQRCPQIAMNLLELMCERIRWVSDSVEEYAAHPLDLRLARRLLTLQKNFADNDGYIEISQNDLADFAGATREATNKILINWQNLGLIKLARRKIFLSEPAKLQHIAQPSFFD